MRSIRWNKWPIAGLVVLACWSSGRAQEAQPVISFATPAVAGNSNDAKAADDLATRVKRLEQQNNMLLQMLQQSASCPKTGAPPQGQVKSGGPTGASGVVGVKAQILEGEPGTAAPPFSATPPYGPEFGNIPPGAGQGGMGREGEPGASAPSYGESPSGIPGGATTGKWVDVGKDFGMRARWVNYQPWLETNDGAFRVHVGGRSQMDLIYAHANDQVRFGKGGIGEFQDAVNFRRMRLCADGWFYENIDYWFEYDFLNTANVDPTTPATQGNTINVPVPIEAWSSINFLPGLGIFRWGNQKNPIGLEHMISSRFLDFLERAPYFDTYINRNNGVQPGLALINWTENQRFTWAFALMKMNNGIYSWHAGGGDYEANARVTWLPWYKNDGRYMIHLGLGVQYDEPDSADAVLRYRWAMRNGPATLHSTVALASIYGHHQTMVQPEFFMNLGPLSIMSEYTFNYLDNIQKFTTQSQGTVAVPGANKSFVSQAFYIQAMYFLTGEHRPYYKTAIHSAGPAPTRVVPIKNFFWLPGQGRFNPFSGGAWQVGARYAYSQLSNSGIYGGDVHEVTLGVNWFLNPNMKIQWNYDVGYRGNLGPGSSSNGVFQGFGTRFAFDF